MKLDRELDQQGLERLLSRTFAHGEGTIEIMSRCVLKPKPSVQRVELQASGRAHSVVVKRLAPEIARRNQLVAERWLPAVGLAGAAPAVLGILTVPDPTVAWLVCEDLGARTLAEEHRDPARVAATVALIARLHRSFADHAFLGEVRLWGGDLGMNFHAGNLRDALRAVDSLVPLVAAAPARAALRERLSARLRRLLLEAPQRAALMERLGGPETLLHGDLWLENIVADPDDPRGVRLIDWDHAAVGPALYDVSTFLFRFPRGERRALWEAYRRELGPCSWDMPGEPELNLLCETAEHARIASHVIWPALAALRGERDANFDELSMVDGWFEELAPALP